MAEMLAPARIWWIISVAAKTVQKLEIVSGQVLLCDSSFRYQNAHFKEISSKKLPCTHSTFSIHFEGELFATLVKLDDLIILSANVDDGAGLLLGNEKHLYSSNYSGLLKCLKAQLLGLPPVETVVVTALAVSLFGQQFLPDVFSGLIKVDPCFDSMFSGFGLRQAPRPWYIGT